MQASGLYYPKPSHGYQIASRRANGLQPQSRCPRCGYPLRYDRRGYVCGYCGFPGTRSPLVNSFREFERTFRRRMESLRQKSQPNQFESMIIQYPYVARQQTCTSCRLRIPPGTMTCPYCGNPQAPPPLRQENNQTLAPVNPVDQRVLDYVASHNGTISISQAARDLAMDPLTLRSSLERLKSSGILRST